MQTTTGFVVVDATTGIPQMIHADSGFMNDAITTADIVVFKKQRRAQRWADSTSCARFGNAYVVRHASLIVRFD